MGIGEILLIIGCAAIVIGVVITTVIRKKKGKTSCDCGCSGCSGCSACAAAGKKDHTKK